MCVGSMEIGNWLGYFTIIVPKYFVPVLLNCAVKPKTAEDTLEKFLDPVACYSLGLIT